MNRSYAWAAIAAGALLAVVWQARTPDRVFEGNRETGIDTNGVLEGRSSPQKEKANEPLASKSVQTIGEVLEPTGRYSQSPVRDKRVEFDPNSPGRATVYYLLETESPRSRFTFVEEVYSIEDDEPELIVQHAATGDEIMLDADPAHVDAAALADFLSEIDGYVSWRSRLSSFVQIKLRRPSVESYLGTIEQLSSLFPNTTVSRDDLYFTSQTPSEYEAALHWHLDQIKAPDAWEFETGSESVVVGVIDTGAQTGHPDLEDNIFINPGEIAGNGIDDDSNGFVDDVSGWDFLDDDAIPNDLTGHGTHVSGLAGATGNNGIGTAGAAWNIKVLPLKVGDSTGLSSSAIAEALRYVSNLEGAGINIVATNNSYGSSTPNNVARTEIQNHEIAGILFVAAAGNDGEDIDAQGNSQFPAGFPEDNVISVANSTQGDDLDFGSNFGSESVDLAAPGKEVYSTYIGGGYNFLTGTSMSSPLVAGAAALLASHDPDLTASQIKQRLLDTVDLDDSLDGLMVSGGRLNLLAALEPSLTGHDIEVASHSGHVVLVPETGFTVEFDVAALDEATVSVLQFDGPQSVTIEPTGDGLFEMVFDQEGAYRFRFLSELGGISREIEKLVVVGDPEDVRDGLMHSWEMEGTGNTLVDSAGSGNATLVGATRVDAPLGGGVDFDGTASYAQFNSGVSSLVTLSAFVRSDNLLSSPHPRIINTPDYYLYFSTRGAVDIPDGNSNVLKFYANRTEEFGVWNSEPDSIYEDEWLHVLATYDSNNNSNTPVLYINGEKQVTRLQGEPVGTQTQTGGESFLGDRAAEDRAWDGQMDEVRIYSRILSDLDVGLLAARYAAGYWDDYSIEVVEDSDTGEVLSLRLVDTSGGNPAGVFDWSIVSGGGAITLGENGASEISVTSSGSVNASIVLCAGSSLGTRYYQYNLVSDPPEIEAGVYVGSTQNGGPVWVEVDESLSTGYITILDTTAGFDRRREPISIDVFGSFTTSESLTQGITGRIDGGMSGEVDSVGLTFSGEQVIPLSAVSDFEGHYSGGLLAEGGELVELLALGSGQVFAWLYGSELDIGRGTITDTGEFSLETERGSQFEGTIDEESESISATLAIDGEVKAVFLGDSAADADNRYVNLSTRGYSDSGERVLIGGFVISGSEPRRLLLRGVGPDLESRGVANFIENPVLKLLQGGEVIAENERWGDAANLAELVEFSEQSGASSLPSGSNDAAMLVDLDPGLYTAFLEANGDPGEGLFEVFDLSGEPDPALINVSTRGYVDGNQTNLIAGFVITGTEPKRVLVRAAGPSLSDQGVQEPLADPIVAIYSASGQIASNDDWSADSLPIVEGASVQGPAKALREAFDASGAFGFEIESKDSAMLIWLEPGLYTAIVSGVGGSSGIALVEVYEAD